MNEQVYKKVGRRYIPLGYSDGYLFVLCGYIIYIAAILQLMYDKGWIN